MRNDAIISRDGVYRYVLTRPGHGAGSTCVIMVNPSTADANMDDATIRKVRGFGLRYGLGDLYIGNLFAYRATDIRELRDAANPVGPDNDHYLLDIIQRSDRLIFAWGPTAKLPRHLRERWKEVVRLAQLASRTPLCLGIAQDGQPRHPLMLPYSTSLDLWRPPE